MGIYLGEEQTTPPTPPSGTWRLYPKSDGWYAKAANGTEYKLVLATNDGTTDHITFGTTGSIILDIDSDDTATVEAFTIRQHSQTTPATLFTVDESNGAWFAAGVSATTFIDRTPFPETLAIARAALASMQPQSQPLPTAGDGATRANASAKATTHTLDHTRLHPFVTSATGHRDLSATVSALVRVVQAQMEQLDALQTAVKQLQTGG